MSKKPEFNVKEFYTDVAKKAGLPEDDAKAFLAMLDKDSVTAILKEHTMTRSDYSRAQDEIKSERDRLSADQTRYQQGYEKNVIWFNQNQKLLADADGMRKRLAELEGRSPDETHQPPAADPNAPSKYATPDDLRSATRNVWELNEQFMFEVRDHYQNTFGKTMPYDRYKELKTLASKPENANRPLRDVYQEFVAPDIETRRTEMHDADLKRVREEGYKEGLSKSRFPAEADVPPEELGPMWSNRPKEPLDDAALERDFYEAGRKVAAATP